MTDLSFTDEELRTMPSEVLLKMLLEVSNNEKVARQRADFDNEKKFSLEKNLLMQEALSRMTIRPASKVSQP